MKRIVFQIMLLISVLFSKHLLAQPGENDSSFNPDDIGLGYGSGASGAVYVSLVQSDGKIIVGGILTEYDNVLSSCIARLNPDGSRDAGFLVGSGASGNNSNIKALAIQNDGRILVGGVFNKFNSASRQSLTRLNPDGSLDNSFATSIEANSVITTVAVQSDGKIIIGGEFYDQDLNIWHLARLNRNGSFDTTFAIKKGPDKIVLASAIQNDGKILIAGEFNLFDGVAKNYIARLNNDGSIDTSFKAIVGSDKRILSLKIQSDNKILAGGDFTKFEGMDRGHIARLNTDGTIDATFGLGLGANNAVNSITVQPSDGKIVIGGVFTSVNSKNTNYVTRLNVDGNPDASFNVGAGANNPIYSTAIQSDGRILIGGTFTTYNNTARSYIARLNTNGSINLPFNLGSGASLTVNTTTLQPDGKVIIGGQFTMYNGALRNRLIRLHTDGRVDPTFYVGTGVDATVYSSALQADNKVVVAGDFSKYNETKINSIARLNNDGTLDTSFNVGLGARKNISTTQVRVVLTTAIQNDGKILLGGQFIYYNGIDRKYLARLNSNGSLDTTFKLGIGPNDYVTAIAQQSDGKVVIGGNFTTINSVKRSKIARLNQDGSLDTNFDPGAGANATVLAIAIQKDGKIIIGGDFTTFNNISSPSLARLNIDGSFDAPFTQAAGPTGSVQVIKIQSDDKILIGGSFYSYNGKDRKSIARINPDGSLDESFNPDGTGANNTVFAMAIQPDDKVIFAGNFTAYNDAGRNRLARAILTGTDVAVHDSKITSELSAYPNPTKGEFRLNLKNGNYQISITNSMGKVLETVDLVNANSADFNIDAPEGLYFISVKNSQGGSRILKVVKE